MERGRSSAAARRSACTNRRAACGRTSSGDRGRSGSTFFRVCSSGSRLSWRRHARHVPSRHQSGEAVPDSRGSGRGDLQPPRHAAGRDRDRAADRSDFHGGRAGVLEREDAGISRRRARYRCERHPAGHALVDRPLRLLRHLHARQSDRAAALGASTRKTTRSGPIGFSAESSGRCANGCVRRSISTAAVISRAISYAHHRPFAVDGAVSRVSGVEVRRVVRVVDRCTT